MENWTLYYDGGCNLCHTSQLTVEKWAAKAHQPLMVDILQSDSGIAKGYGDSMVLEINGVPHYGADAWLQSMRIAPIYLRWISAARFVPPLKWLAHWGYGIVAKYRIKWFGSRECQLPPRQASVQK